MTPPNRSSIDSLQKPLLGDGTGTGRWIARILLSTLLGVVGFSQSVHADFPDKSYRVLYVPSQIQGRDFRIDNNGTVFSVSSVATGRFSSSNTFHIYRPGRTGGHSPGVQNFPGPATPNQGVFSITGLNQKEQFVVSETGFGDDHQFLYDGTRFVELRPPDPFLKQAPIPGWPDLFYSNVVHPNGILDDGSAWGVTDSLGLTNGPDFGGEMTWDISGNAFVTFPFRSGDDPLKLGFGPNQKRHFLRSTAIGFLGAATDFVVWDGSTSSFLRSQTFPSSRPLHMNDQDEVAGIEDVSGNIWIDLPNANYGLSAGRHVLAGVLAGDVHDFLFNNKGQIFISTSDTNAPLKIWEKGVWRNVRVHDPNNPNLEVVGASDMNHFGSVLAFTRPKDSIGTSQIAVLIPEDLTIDVIVAPRELTMPEEFDMQLKIRNNMDIALKNVGIVPSTMFFTGAVIADWIKAPPSLLSLKPGESGVLHYGFRSKAPGNAQIHFQVEGQNSGGGRVTFTESLTTSNILVHSDVQGDLLIKRDEEPDAQFSGDDVYQTLAIGSQVRTNYTVTNILNQFQVQIQNDGKKTSTFRLNAVENTNQGWSLKYLLGGEDITASIRTFSGLILPPLATNEIFTVTVQITATNAPLNAALRCTIALASTNNPPQTLDVVDALVRVVPEIVVNSTGDLPDQDVQDCCCNTGKLTANQKPECTLRAAIQTANATDTPVKIRFAIEDSPDHRANPAIIKPKSVLPDIHQTVFLEGFSQVSTPSPIAAVVLDGFETLDPGGELTSLNGLTVRSDGGIIAGLVISGFPNFGLHIVGQGNRVEGCLIGTDFTGTRAKANGLQGLAPDEASGGGIWVEGAFNQIGSSTHENLISGLDNAYGTSGSTLEALGTILTGFGTRYTGPAILIDSQAHHSIVLNNSIGMNLDGTASTAERDAKMTVGIQVESDDNLIGSVLVPTRSNLIGFCEYAISIRGKRNFVYGNYIGTDGGTLSFPNRVGVSFEGPSHTLMFNSVANNEFQVLAEKCPQLLIFKNDIGRQPCTDFICKIPRQYLGIQIAGSAEGTLILSNTVTANLYEGIRIGEIGNPTDGVTITNNDIYNNGREGKAVIGVDLPFASFSIDSGNRQSFDRYAGIHIVEGVQNLISRNRLYDNYGPAILLGQAYTDGTYDETLDVGDVDEGPNTLLNYPIWGAATAQGLTYALGVYLGAPNQQFHIELFSSSQRADEADSFVTEFDVVTDEAGVVKFEGQKQNSVTVFPGLFLSGTATDMYGNTSELGRSTLAQSLDDADQDGLSDGVEDQVPGDTPSSPPPNEPWLADVTATGDGNQDGIRDAVQNQVASFPTASRIWVTLSMASNLKWLAVDPVPPALPPYPQGYYFPLGTVSCAITNLTSSDTVTVTNRIHSNVSISTMFVLVPSIGGKGEHWVEFSFDGSTGFLAIGKEFEWFLKDGGRGDRDGVKDGIIHLVIAPAYLPTPGPRLEFVGQSMVEVSRVLEHRSGNTQSRVTNSIPVTLSTLAWPLEFPNGVLESTDTLIPAPLWKPIATVPENQGNRWVVTNASLTPLRFYRLRSGN